MKRLLLAGVSAMLLGVQTQTRAAPITYNVMSESTYDDIGVLTSGEGPAGAQCASTSMINSFMFLAAEYPNVYGNNALTTEGGTTTPTGARNDLDASIANAAFQGDVWNAKLNWVNRYAPGSTTFSAITSTRATSKSGMAYTNDRGAVQFSATGADMWTWLMQEINAGEDVELGLYNHMTTLMGYAIGSDGSMYLQIIDPNSPTPGGNGQGPGASGNGPVGEWVTATEDSGDLKLSGFSFMDYKGPYVYALFAESPAVPEPATITMLGSGAICLGVFCWRRRKQTVAA